MTINELLAQAAKALALAGINEAALDARLLLQHASGMERTALIVRGEQEATPWLLDRYQRLVQERSRRIPLQYLTASQEFWSLDFLVTPAVLIPRPETEFLVQQVLDAYATGEKPSRILDLCTGSGVIAVVLAREWGKRVLATDLSPAALAVAASNVGRHGVTDKVVLLCADLCTALQPDPYFDLIVSNPPYVAEKELATLQPEVVDWEPYLALSGGSSGLVALERIADQAAHLLRPGGQLFLEIGADQQEAVLALFASPERPYEEVRVEKDWAGRPRVLRAHV